MIRVIYSATFEFSEDKPETIRGTLEAASMPSCARAVARRLQKMLPRRRWASICLVMERQVGKNIS